MIVSLLVSVTENGVIGRDGQLACRIGEDLRRLKRLTMGHHVIMGRKTYESVGRPLPGRTNLVVSRDRGFRAAGAVVCHSLEQALEAARAAGDSEAFVLGGGEIYRLALEQGRRVYMTRIHADLPGDTRFPSLGPEWVEIEREDHPGGDPVSFSYITYDRDLLYEPILSRRELHAGGYLRLEELVVRLPDGREARREVVRAFDAVAVLPIDIEERVHLVRQHRPAIGRTLLEAPAGIVNAGENPEEAARRECGEEIGLVPGRLDRLVCYAHAEGYSTGFITLFIGRELQPVESPGLDATEFLERVVLPFDELRRRVLAGRIADSKTILTTLFWDRMRGASIHRR